MTVIDMSDWSSDDADIVRDMKRMANRFREDTGIDYDYEAETKAMSFIDQLSDSKKIEVLNCLTMLHREQ